MNDGIYEVREYINGGSDWYSHWFESRRAAAQWVTDRGSDLQYGSDILFRWFADD